MFDRLAKTMDLEVRPSRTGLGAFATRAFGIGDVVVDWTLYPRCTFSQLPDPYVVDRYVQVAKDLFVGSADPAEVDDYINHSCDPNCFIRVALPAIHLVALRAIAKGEEVTFDYGATMEDDPWEMKCECGSAGCRKIIRAKKSTDQEG